ncbi:MAG: hypothetical protein R3F21_06240, partial [Myxococcota bacterium]
MAFGAAIGVGLGGCLPATEAPEDGSSAVRVHAAESASPAVADAAVSVPKESPGTAAASLTTGDEGWLRHGRTDDEQRFSPLDQIDETNVA